MIHSASLLHTTGHVNTLYLYTVQLTSRIRHLSRCACDLRDGGGRQSTISNFSCDLIGYRRLWLLLVKESGGVGDLGSNTGVIRAARGA